MLMLKDKHMEIKMLTSLVILILLMTSTIALIETSKRTVNLTSEAIPTETSNTTVNFTSVAPIPISTENTTLEQLITTMKPKKKRKLVDFKVIKNVELPAKVMFNYREKRDYKRYGLSLPIECPSVEYRLVKPKRCNDKCVPCPKGYSVEIRQSSYRPKNRCIKTVNNCPLDDTKSALGHTGSRISCMLQCKCSIKKCFYGTDPCACKGGSIICEIDHYMTKAGVCVKCPPGYSKPEIGCHGCVRTESLKRYALYTFMLIQKNNLHSIQTTTTTIAPMKQKDEDRILFAFPCYVDVCTFPLQYCDSIERRCSVCSMYICSSEMPPPACRYYCQRFNI